MVSVVTTQFYSYCMKAALDNMQANGLAVFQQNFIYKTKGGGMGRAIVCQLQYYSLFMLQIHFLFCLNL